MSPGAPTGRVELPGSGRVPDPGHTRVGDIDLQAEIEVSVYVRPRGSLAWVDAAAALPPGERRLVSRGEWAQEFGAHPADIHAVESFAAQSGLSVTGRDGPRRVVVVRGTVQAVAQAFGADMIGMYRDPGTGATYRGRSGPLTVPDALAGVVVGVFGLDNRPQARANVRRRAFDPSSYTPVGVAQAYAFPAGFTGAGETVGIVELAGGFQASDLTTYFGELGLASPAVTAVSVDGGENQPGEDTDSDAEVMLDIEVVGAVANGVSIAVYFAPNTDPGGLDQLGAVRGFLDRPGQDSDGADHDRRCRAGRDGDGRRG